MSTPVVSRTVKARERRQAAIIAAVKTRVGFLRISECASLLGVTRQTLWQWSRRGILPEPITIGGRTGPASVSGHPAAVIADLMEGRAAPTARA